jgi:hypothetical protein
MDQAALDRFTGEPLLIGVRPLLQARRLLEEVAKGVGSVRYHKRIPSSSEVSRLILDNDGLCRPPHPARYAPTHEAVPPLEALEPSASSGAQGARHPLPQRGRGRLSRVRRDRTLAHGCRFKPSRCVDCKLKIPESRSFPGSSGSRHYDCKLKIQDSRSFPVSSASRQLDCELNIPDSRRFPGSSAPRRPQIGDSGFRNLTALGMVLPQPRATLGLQIGDSRFNKSLESDAICGFLPEKRTKGHAPPRLRCDHYLTNGRMVTRNLRIFVFFLFFLFRT